MINLNEIEIQKQAYNFIVQNVKIFCIVCLYNINPNVILARLPRPITLKSKNTRSKKLYPKHFIWTCKECSPYSITEMELNLDIINWKVRP